MEDNACTCARAQPFFIACEGVQRLPGGAEQQVVAKLGMVAAKVVDFVRNSEHNVLIANG